MTPETEETEDLRPEDLKEHRERLVSQVSPADRPMVHMDVTASGVPVVLLGYQGFQAPPAPPAPTDTASPRSVSWP